MVRHMVRPAPDAFLCVNIASISLSPFLFQYPVQYSATTDDHQPNTMLFRRGRSQSYIRHILDAYESGAVRYESVKLKGWFREIVGMGW